MYPFQFSLWIPFAQLVRAGLRITISIICHCSSVDARLRVFEAYISCTSFFILPFFVNGTRPHHFSKHRCARQKLFQLFCGCLVCGCKRPHRRVGVVITSRRRSRRSPKSHPHSSLLTPAFPAAIPPTHKRTATHGGKPPLLPCGSPRPLRRGGGNVGKGIRRDEHAILGPISALT